MNPLFLTVALLLGSAVVIYLACEYFVNGVEWVGRKFAVGQQATSAVEDILSKLVVPAQHEVEAA